ncbi:Pectate lyase superfamily protein [Bremerella volcania]|uniref:Pectate lyase superfamily protein n=2 Tax=Bremerella volcania TaxID=2527984 RepID=A0A518CF50_9BACT|nr:Pectate lyase superfamily protein [Bremerella volcania]
MHAVKFFIPSLLLICLPSLASAENILFPDDSGVIDVTKAPYGAIPDDGKDDSRAIQQALCDHVSGNHIFYFPNGVYDIGDTLFHLPEQDPLKNKHACLELRDRAKRNILIGQSEQGTILRLMDNVNEEFADAVLWFGPSPAQRFRNGLRHMTVSVGKDHPKASGVLFNASNQGGIRQVTIKSEDPQHRGAVGLDMGHTDEVGPLLVQHLTVDGFDRGIKCAYQTASQTFEHIKLRNQREYGWTNGFSQSIFVRDLEFQGSVTAIHNGPTMKGDPGQSRLLLIDSQLTYTGNGSPPVAIRNQKAAFLRNIRADGFRAIVSNEIQHGRGNPTVVDSPLVEYIANGSEASRKGKPFTLFPSPAQSLGLPIEEPTQVDWEQDLSRWASPHQFPMGYSGRPDDDMDDTPSIQAAIDSGATTVYLPRGRWLIQSGLYLRNNVRHFVGCEAMLSPVKDQRATVVLVDGTSPAVLIEGLEAGGITFTQDTHRELQLRHILGGQYQPGLSHAGKLFLTDVCLGPLKISDKQNVWARQLNIESQTDPGDAKVVNNGGTLWILGMKTEDEGTVIKTLDGGRTELLGHKHVAHRGQEPSFVTIQAAFSAALAAGSALETRGNETKTADNFNSADLYVAYEESMN